VYLSEADYLALLDRAPAGSRVLTCLVAAERIERKINQVTPEVPAIDLGLKLANEGEKGTGS
jgi:hypothetical protein